MSRECVSRMCVMNRSRDWESRNGVTKRKKFGGVGNGDPKGSNYLIKNMYEINIDSVDNVGPSWLGPFLKRSIPYL